MAGSLRWVIHVVFATSVILPVYPQLLTLCGRRHTDAMVELRRGLLASAPFPIPLIELDVPISGIQLSDWLHRKAHDAAVSGRRSRRSKPHAP